MASVYEMDGTEDVLDYFDITEIQTLIKDSIASDDSLPGDHVDMLRPMWTRYNHITEIDGNIIDDDTKLECTRRFDIICGMFIDAICAKFNMSIDDGWFEEIPKKEVHAFTVMLYSFFVQDISRLLEEVFIKYIETHSAELADQFGQDIKLRKDATYNSVKDVLESDYAIIVSNIYEICFNILDTITESEFFGYIDNDYVPKATLIEYYNNGHFDGEFVDAIYTACKRDRTMLSRICFDVISNIKTNHKVQEKDGE